MSGMGGILRLDGASVDPELLHKMALALQYRGQDGNKVWHEGPIGLVHCHFWTTPEEVGEEQPVHSPDGRLWITADARVDNRDELIPLLEAAGYLYKEVPSDAEVILAAYQRWGEGCAQHLVGDFAFAIWDASARRLFLARDVIGIRQLYYAVIDGVLYFANTIGAVLAALPRQPALNRPLIYEFLRGSYRRWICQTVYEEVLRLPPAHHLVVDGKVPKPMLYYVLGSGPVPHCTSDEEWLQAFRHLFQEAVRYRLRSQTPVQIMVSGGLDSSAIACTAYELAKEGASLPGIQLFSAIYPQTPTADESEFFDAIAAHCAGFTATRMVSDQFWALYGFWTSDFPLDEPDIYPFRDHVLAMLRVISVAGCRVVLLGTGGDQALCQNLYYEPATLRGVGWRDWLAEARYFLEWNHIGWILLLFQAYIRPVLQRSIAPWAWTMRARWRNLQPWIRCLNYAGTPVNFLPDIAFFNPPGLTPSAVLMHRNIREPRDIISYSALDVTAAYAGVELRYPFLDRRLVDFLLYIPHHLRAWRGMDRVIARESLKGMLPEIVRLRYGKAQFASLVHRGLQVEERRNIETLLDKSCAEALGFIDAECLRDAFETYWCNGNVEYGELLRPLYLEAWLRNRVQPSSVKCKGGCDG
ncbi:MAG: hypothetical protein H5T68_10995 [Chloroflexi bacterium]|nr:hypothetical protein [Chloroflexota bacterium]